MIGCVCVGNQQMMGLTHPTWCPLWSAELHETGAELIASNAILAGVVRGAPVSDIKAPRTTDLKLIYDGETMNS